VISLIFTPVFLIKSSILLRILSKQKIFLDKTEGCGSFGTVAQRQAMTSFRSAIAGHLW
jgi:hypothetical protein